MNTNFIISFELLKDKISSTEKYPFNLPIVKHLDTINLHKNVTFLVWENGTWKSTLLEALAVQYWFNPEGGSKNFSFSTEKTHSELSEYIRIAKWASQPKDWYFLRAESFYNVSSNIDELEKVVPWLLNAYGWKSLHEQSHWESFFSLFLHRFWWNGVYILDEPEAALSPQRQLAFLVRLDELVKQNSQIIIATHSPILLSYPHSKIIQISDKWFEEVEYKDTDHFDIYNSFLNNSEYMLKKMGIE